MKISENLQFAAEPWLQRLGVSWQFSGRRLIEH
jgi:hypothetical protein